MSEPILIISDTHYHNFHQYAQTNAKGVNSRLADIIRATVEAAKTLRNQGGKHIIHCGDVFHVRGNIPPTVLNPVMDMYRSLINMGFEIHMISGNHDLETNDATRVASTATALADVGVKVYNDRTMVGIADQYWTFIPWVNSLNALRAEIQKCGTVGSGAVSNLVIHAPLNGVIEGLPDHGLSPKDFDGTNWSNVFVGHYHNHKSFPIHNGRAWSVGALTHQSWGDADAVAGYMLYYPATNTVQQRATSAPVFLRVPVDTLDTLDPKMIADNYIKVVDGEFTDPTEIETIRNDLTLQGAKAVIVDGLVKRPAVTRAVGSTTTAPTIQSILGDYIDRNYPGEPEVKLTALQILGEVYD